MNFWCVFQLTVELFILIPTKKPTHIFRRLLVKLVKYTQQYERVKKRRRKKPATMTKQIKQVLESLGNHTLKLIGASVSNGDFSFITGTKKKPPPNNNKKTTSIPLFHLLHVTLKHKTSQCLADKTFFNPWLGTSN